jgi:Flp pilus assembly protein TadD
VAAWLLAGLCLAACAETDPLDTALAGGPFPPTAIATDAPGVDGLTVGNRLMSAGEYELALDAFFRAGAEQGMTSEVLSSIGSANLKLGRLDQSERQLRQAIEADPQFVPAWNNLGVVLMEQGEYGEASRVFQTAFAIDSGNSDDIRNNLRLALAKTEQLRYGGGSENNEFDLVWQGNGSYLLVSP